MISVFSYFRSNDGSQNTFAIQPTFQTLELKKDKGTDYALSLESKGVFNSKLKPLYTAFLYSINISEYKMDRKFDKAPLPVEQNYYLTKIGNVYIAYDLDAWRKIPLRNFTLKNCLFGATNIVKNTDKGKYVYSGCGIALDGKGEWSFGSGYARNMIFGVDNSSSSHAVNLKNNFLVLGKGDTFGINGSYGTPEKRVLILVKQTQNFA